MRTVVLVEDNPGDVALIKLAIENRGDVRLEIIQDGRRALELIASPAMPDSALFIIDLNLPGCDGFGVLEALRDLPTGERTIEPLVLTSSTRDSDRERALALGARDVLAKPASLDDVDELAVRLSAMVDRLPVS